MSYLLPETDPVLASCRGLVTAHPDLLALSQDPLYVRALDPSPDRRVALVSGGGSGHEPLHAGLLGRGGLDAVAPGRVFASPHNRQIGAASRSTLRAGGVLHIVKNYTGDRINFGVAAERLRADGIPVEQVLVTDDVATSTAGAGRRGTAATVVVEKILGAAADQGAGLEELAALGREVVDRSRSLAVCTRAHTSPSTLQPAFDLAPAHADYGVGIHGERGSRSVPLPRVEDLVRRMLSDLCTAVPDAPEGVLLVVNGLGSTSLLELQAVTAIATDQLGARGHHVAAALTGTHVGALDMAGLSLTLTALRPGWLTLWQADTHTPLTTWPRTAALPRTHITPPDLLYRPAAPKGSSALLDRYAAIVSQVRDSLTALDQLAGDGDFGDNLASGLARAKTRARETDEDGMTAAADVFLNEVGGTSGPLLGLLFQHLAAATAACPDGQRPAVPALAEALAAGCAAIRRVGGAGSGDRTLVDALLPAAQSLHDADKREREGERAVTDAALAAVEGARGTAGMLGARGRSSYIGARALGIPDPGAVGVALLLIAAADVYEPRSATALPAPGHLTRHTPSTPVA
ncbi:dihydroxyacetone kinase subunit DhaK [Streptomyces olivaceus]|uniref:dihydroxyacetone kinase subunit DhaK n=1 Tax=Streptomyces olivaceus TaxID=47716 RepID=UPI001CCB24D5|nr:dihydroxyacetone kinase subunit DhaK [Streptomyces olivaceus]MBZ6212054.1 dihydroxyacetone kinase subunit DhaK [Streptomyces olivaceus]